MTSRDISKSKDSTLERNNIERWKFLISEYCLTKQHQHPHFRFVTDFYKFHKLKRQNFIKYYNRFKDSNFDEESTLLPLKRGPKYSTRRVVSKELENEVLRLRKHNGLSRFEIHHELSNKFVVEKIPSSSTIYNILKKHRLNVLSKEIMGNSRKEIRRIIKDLPGDLGHIDCHYLPKNIIENDNNRYYLVAIMDDCTRLVWIKLLDDIQALTVMFNSLEILTSIKQRYGFEFKEILSDNGSEFGGSANLNNKYTHPFERLLKELNIKHRYTKPYRPQTNGKIERFWKTLNEDLLDEMVFDSLEHLRDELLRYCLYYNEMRPHSGVENKTPKQFLEKFKQQGTK